jgi:hypothetical protein
MPLPDEDMLTHSRGQVVIAGSRVIQCVMARCSIKKGAKVKHTLNRQGNAIVYGNAEVSGTIELDLTDEGPERDWIGELLSQKKYNTHYEIPLYNIHFQIGLDTADVEMPLDDAIKLTLNFVGAIRGGPTA